MGGRGASSGLTNSTGKKKLEKGIRTKQKRIKEHISYIRNPKIKYKNWDSFSDDRKSRELGHWKQELKNFRNEINIARRRIREYDSRDK